MEELDEFGIPIKKTNVKKPIVDEFGIPVKKKDGTNVPSSSSTTQKPTSDSATQSKDGSLVTPKKYRLPNESDFEQMQQQGIVAPPSEIEKRKSVDVKIDRNELLGRQTPVERVENLPISKTENKKATQEEIANRNTPSIVPIEKEKEAEALYDFKESDKQGLKSKIDEKIEKEDLLLDKPFASYSSYDKPPIYDPALQTYVEQEKDNFVSSNFGEDKLSELGIDASDFDGFINKNGYKQDYLNREEKGLFENDNSRQNPTLAKEANKFRMLNLYIKEKNRRENLKRDLEANKENLERPFTEKIKPSQVTVFEPAKIESYVEAELPNLYKKLKERDSENQKILEAHNKGEANLLYGAKQTFKSGWNGFVDRLNNSFATVYDKIGLDTSAEEVRLLHEENQMLRPDTRDVGYVSGKKANFDGVNYIVDESGQIYDADKKIRVTDLMFKETYDKINELAQKGERDYIYSPQGTAIQAGGVLGDILVQILATKGAGNIVSGISGASKIGLGVDLSKIPMSRNLSNAIIAQSALGYSSGMEETLKTAKEQGLNDDEAQMLASDASQRMALLYAITAPISPQTKATQALFGSESKNLIKKAVLAYKEGGKKGFVETLKGGLPKLAKNIGEFTEEGVKELFQENIQQTGENYVINAETNRQAGKQILKESISGDEFINTSILSFLTSGLASQAKMPTFFSNAKVDQLKTLGQISQDIPKFESNLKEMVSSKIITPEIAEKLKADVKAYSNNQNKIPKDASSEVAMDLMRKLEEINQLESQKKTLDKSFHKGIDEKIEAKREEANKLYINQQNAKTEIPITQTEQKVEVQEQTKEQKVEQPQSTASQQNEDGSYGFNLPKADSKKAEIPDWHREEHEGRINQYQKWIDEYKEDLKKEESKGMLSSWLSDSKTEKKWIKKTIKKYEDKIKLLQENPVEFYRSELKRVKESHEERVEDDPEFKQRLIDEYGSADFEVTSGNLIDRFNNTIFDYEAVQKTANKNAKQTKQPTEFQEVSQEVVTPEVEQKPLENEATPPSNIEPNGNVQLRVEQLGESGAIAEPTAPINKEENLPEATQSTTSKGNAEVKKIKVYRGEPKKVDIQNKDIMWVTPNKELADEYSYDLGIGKKGSLEKGIVTESEIEVPKNPLILNYKGDTEVKSKDIGGGLRIALKEAYRSGKISIEKSREISEKISKYEDLAGNNLEAWHTKVNKPSVTGIFVEIAKDLGFDGIQANEGRKGQDVGYGLFKEASTPKNEITQQPSLEDISSFLTQKFKANEQATTTSANDGSKIESVQENRPMGEETKQAEQKVKKLSLRGRTPLDKRKIKDVEMISSLNTEVYDPYSLVQQYFIGGGRILTDDVKKLLNSGEEARLRLQYARTKDKKGSTINEIAHYLWEEHGEMLNLESEDFRDAVEEVVTSFMSPKAMAVDLNSRFGMKYQREQDFREQEAFYEEAKNLGIANEEEHNLALSYLDVMTDEEIMKLADEYADFEEFLANEENKKNREISDKVRNLKVNLGKLSGGGLQSNVLGLPVAIWNTSMDIIATSIDAGMEISDAIKRGLNYIQKNHRGQWNKKQFNDEVLKELGVRGIEINGQDVIVKPQTKEDAKVVDGFYSDIEKSLIDTKKDNLTASEWETIIGKSDEAKWTGLTDWLSQQQGSVSKADIQQFLKDNRIQVVEVVKGKTEWSEVKKGKWERPIDKENLQGRKTAGKVVIQLIDGKYYGEPSTTKYTRVFNTLEEAQSYYDGVDGFSTDTKFSKYQVEGEKENYKEVLVTLPSINESQKSLDSKLKEKGYVMTSDGLIYPRTIAGYADINNSPNGVDFAKLPSEVQKIASKLKSTIGGKDFKSSHFDEANILVHLRMNTRTDADGKKVLFLEEVQSDWGQKGKKEGFVEDIEKTNWKTPRVVNGNKVYDSEKGDFTIIDRGNGNISLLNKDSEELFDGKYTTVEEAKEGADNEAVQYGRGGIPTAPFVMDTNTWTKLGLKVALKEAVKQGVDKIAWTTGEQQNDRYDLSKQVDGIDYVKNENGNYDLIISTNKGEVLNYDNQSINQVESILGKDMASKIDGGEGRKGMIGNRIDGNDLKVGGKGMKGFYGSPSEGKLGIIGEVVKALTKQEPKTITLKTDNGVPKNEFSANAVRDELPNVKNESTQYSIDITPELKSEVEKGLPMFGNLKEQRKAMVNAEVDKIAQKVKDLLPGIKDPDLKKQGFSQDQLIDLVATAVKNLIAAGIEIDEAIKQVVSSLKERFGDLGFEIDPNKVKSILNPPNNDSNFNDFEKAVKSIPISGIIKKYLSGETIEEVYGTPENPQEYDSKILNDLGRHGEEVITKAKEIFGIDYIEKSLEALDSSNLNSFEKAIQYVALMNEVDLRLQNNPNNITDKKLQKLIYAKYQKNARIGSLTINAGRLMNIMKNGIDVNKQAEKIFSSKQKEAKNEIEKIVQVTPDGINKAMDSESVDIEKAIEEGVEKRITELYSKLPTARRIKADKAIRALENIQKRLRSKTYDATIGVPIAIIDSGISVIKNSIKAGVNIADAIEAGINHIKEKYGKDWEKESQFRQDMLDGFSEEGIDTSKIEKSNKDAVKELLIEAGFSREVKSKGEVKTLFDWKKLAGEEGSVDKIKENVENVLKSKNYSKNQIEDASKEFESEYNRLSEEIINKGLAELENRNLIKPSPNRKIEAKRLAELFNYGLMKGDSVQYDNIMNKVLGLSDLDAESYQKIKNATKALADIFNAKRKQGRLTEGAVSSLTNQINHNIKTILHDQAFRNASKRYKTANIASEFAGLAQKSLLENPGNALENILSGVYASVVARSAGALKKELTPEMRKQNSINAKVIFDDINTNAGLFYGDTNTSLITQSRIEEWLNGKSDNRLYHAILSFLTGRVYLQASDSMAKSDITNSYFAKNVIEILTHKSNPEGPMTAEEALMYISDNTTGIKFDEAVVEAKKIIDEINGKQTKKQIADSPQAVHRFAMDIVRDNLISGGRMTKDQVEKAYIAGYKSAGRDIGHVANNWVSASVNYLNSNIQTMLENSIKEKEWDRATLLTLTSIITKNIMNPFVGGGTNWIVRNATKAGIANPLSAINLISDYAMRKPIDLSTETGRKHLEEALYRKANFQSTAATSLVGTTIALMTFALMKYGDDEEENLLTINEWLKKNEWAKKYFDKLSPETAAVMIAMENEELGDHYIKSLGMKTDYFDQNMILLRSLDKENQSSVGIGASIATSPFSMPGPWRMYRDVQNMKRGLNGIPPIKSEPRITSFWNGVFKGGFIDYIGLRPDAIYGTKEELEEAKKQRKKDEKGEVYKPSRPTGF